MQLNVAYLVIPSASIKKKVNVSILPRKIKDLLCTFNLVSEACNGFVHLWSNIENHYSIDKLKPHTGLKWLNMLENR